ncbi:hypothetical protein D3C86_2170570 [compost metagenome]
MGAHEGDLGLLIGNQVDADIQATQFGRLKLNLGGLEVGTRQVHDAIDHFFGPAALMHGDRLVDR